MVHFVVVINRLSAPWFDLCHLLNPLESGIWYTLLYMHIFCKLIMSFPLHRIELYWHVNQLICYSDFLCPDIQCNWHKLKSKVHELFNWNKSRRSNILPCSMHMYYVDCRYLYISQIRHESWENNFCPFQSNNVQKKKKGSSGTWVHNVMMSWQWR